jgi:hypothetical protein
MPDMVEVVIDSIRVSLMSPQRVVVLRQVDSDRYLPIWVGPYEAEAITVALQEIVMARPLTHDLLKNVFNTFAARLRRVEIVGLREDIFFGNIVAEVDGKTINIDARPSDAIAIAVRAHIPIMVDPGVMDTAGIIPEKDLEQVHPPGEGAALPEASSDRLSVFEDFLEKLDVEDLGDEDNDKPDKNKPDKKT